MFNYKGLLCSTVLILVGSSIFAQEIIINEVMSDNENYLSDEVGDYVDWVELYNRSSHDVQLGNYYLSDDLDAPSKWQFPERVLKSHELLIVYASSKDYFNEVAIHTNFKIDSDGETITLFKGSELIDLVDVPALDANHSYGRNQENNYLWQFMISPTLGTVNDESKYLAISLNSGFYSQPQPVFIEGEGTDVIRYTVDGGTPTPNSPIFEQGMTIDYIDNVDNYFCNFPSSTEDEFINNPAWVEPESNMTKGHVMRFASFRNDTISSTVMSRSYFISDGSSYEYSMPVISLIVKEEDFFSDSSGIYVPGDKYDDDNPVWSGNFFESGREWERPAHMNYFDKDGTMEIDQCVGIRIHGGKTRNAAQKSLRLYARSEYGNSHLDYKFLPNTENNQFKRLILRTTMGGWAGDVIFKDEFAQSSVRSLNLFNQDYQPVIVMLNGEFWGIHTIRDRMDLDYLSYKTGLNDHELEIKEGFNQDFEDMREYMKTNDMSLSAHYDYISELIDIDHYIDYNIVQMYYRNYDWPANNNKWWREKEGKWKNLIYDLDAAFDDYEYNMIEHNTLDDPDVGWPNNSRSTLIFRKLLENEVFVDAFLTRYTDLLENIFRPERLLSLLEEVKGVYAPELPKHIERWTNPSSVASMDSDIQESIIAFIKNRPCIVQEHLEVYFNVDLDYVCPEVLDTNPVMPIPAHNSLMLFPNPALDQVNLKLNGASEDSYKVRVTNVLGQLIFSDDRVNFTEGVYSLKLFEAWPTGIYLVTLISNKDVIFTEELIIR